MSAAAPATLGSGALARVTEALHWFVVQSVLLVIASAPTAVCWLLLAQDASNLPLYALSGICVFPAVAASLWAWRSRRTDTDPVPARRFVHGYRVNFSDSLKIGVPTVVVLTVLLTNISHGEAAGTGALSAAFAVLAGIVVLIAVRALSIASAFSFRLIDVLRLSVFTLMTMPLRTLALISLAVLVLGAVVLVGDYVLLLAAAALTLALGHGERTVLERLRAQFVREGEQEIPR